MYEVIKAFADREDKNRSYKIGDKYPREGFEPSEERIGFLMSYETTLGEPVIAEVKEDTEEETEVADEKAEDVKEEVVEEPKKKRSYTPRKSKENK